MVLLLDESLLSALCMNVLPDLGLEDGVRGGMSAFLVGVTAAPKEFVRGSGAGLGGGDFVEGGDAVPETEGCGVEFEENLELMLDIHEFRLPGGATLGSLGLFEELEPGDSAFSELCR